LVIKTVEHHGRKVRIYSNEWCIGWLPTIIGRRQYEVGISRNITRISHFPRGW
jgi:hypothetical protein